ncbi:uroporphyrinogen-III synthase [Sunxiuqinia sp. sy24]|uniref:uroporphyrinogen-III synthase n=1 Tax=Sunxiuqinia sp. sy24 TaxID=3461495 RepID=UPI00404561E6
MELPAIFIGRKLSALTRKWLVSEQIRFIEQPLIRITYRKPDVALFNSWQGSSKKWVVTSSYAAHWLLRFADGIGFEKGEQVYCLSEKQEGILTRCGVKVLRPASPNAYALAELLLKEDKHKKIVYLRGNKSLNPLEEMLDQYQQDWQAVEVYKNTSIEILMNEVFDGYLFFSESAIKSYKASGNFPPPKAPVLANGNRTAQAAWAEFPNLVLESHEQEELSFVKYAIRRITEKLNEPEPTHRIIIE